MTVDMHRKKINFGIIGLGLMGKEFASAAARWCHLLDDGPVPVIKGICNKNNLEDREWFTSNFPDIENVTGDYRKLLTDPGIDAIYCAVPHNLHEEYYIQILEAGKHLLGEKPFGIDLAANRNILGSIRKNPGLIVRCSSEFAYYPGARRIIDWLRERNHGRLMEVRCGFHHSSDMDLGKPINWKRMIAINGEYGCMGDLGFHLHFIPLRFGWIPDSVIASLQNIATERPSGTGTMVPCETWDNATVITESIDPLNGMPFIIQYETKRMAPGQTNTWFIEVYGTKGSARYSTHEPKAFYTLETTGREQGWKRTDIGADSFMKTITGGIFESGFSDSMLQMLGAYLWEFKKDGSSHPFPTGHPDETHWSHQIMTAALESNRTGNKIKIRTP
jgi:predicted dehydrogenase